MQHLQQQQCQHQHLQQQQQQQQQQQHSVLHMWSGGCTLGPLGPHTSCTLMQQRGLSGTGWQTTSWCTPCSAASSILQVGRKLPLPPPGIPSI
jgi:hypothetical protein